MPRTTLTILTGLLGSGKTTLLNAMLRDTPEPLGVIVDDFGSINVDAALVGGQASLDGEVALQNGCICCTIRGDLLMALLRLRKRACPPRHVVIEASGVSAPAAIARRGGLGSRPHIALPKQLQSYCTYKCITLASLIRLHLSSTCRMVRPS